MRSSHLGSVRLSLRMYSRCHIAIASFSLLVELTPYSNPDDGVADPIYVDVEDPDFDTPPSEAQHGDVAYIFGDWVMDEEHEKYFEIHPIKAYYPLCRTNDNPDNW